MEKLIEALQIFLKYDNPTYPLHCEHDILRVLIDPKLVSEEDKQRLETLSFREEEDCFYSYHYGSA